MNHLKKDDLIGSVSEMNLIKDKPIYASFKGMLMQLREPRLVETKAENLNDDCLEYARWIGSTITM